MRNHVKRSGIWLREPSLSAVLLLLIIVPSPSLANQREVIIVHGPNFEKNQSDDSARVSFKMPDGFVLDDTAAREAGLFTFAGRRSSDGAMASIISIAFQANKWSPPLTLEEFAEGSLAHVTSARPGVGVRTLALPQRATKTLRKQRLSYRALRVEGDQADRGEMVLFFRTPAGFWSVVENHWASEAGMALDEFTELLHSMSIVIFEETRWALELQNGQRAMAGGSTLQAEKSLLVALKQARRSATPLDVGACQVTLGKLYLEQRRLDEAEQLYRAAIRTAENLRGPERVVLGVPLNGLAELHRLRGDFAEAEQVQLRSLELRREFLGPDSPAVATSLDNLADIYCQQQRYEEAETAYEQAVDIWTRSAPADPADLETARANLLGVRLLLADRDALQGDQKRLEQTLSALAESTGSVFLNSLHQGKQAVAEGRYDDAEAMFLAAIEAGETSGSWSDLLGSLHALAKLYSSQEEFSKSEPLLLRAVSVVPGESPRERLMIATVRCDLGNNYLGTGKPTLAVEELERCAAIREAILGDGHIQVGLALGWLAAAYRDRAAPSKAVSSYERATAILQQQPDLARVDLAMQLHALGELYEEQQELDKASSAAQRAMMIGMTGDEDQSLAYLRRLGHALIAQRFYGAAESSLRLALMLLERRQDDPDLPFVLGRLACVRLAQGDRADAQAFFERAEENLEAAAAKGDRRAAHVLGEYGRMLAETPESRTAK